MLLKIVILILIFTRHTGTWISVVLSCPQGPRARTCITGGHKTLTLCSHLGIFTTIINYFTHHSFYHHNLTLWLPHNFFVYLLFINSCSGSHDDVSKHRYFSYTSLFGINCKTIFSTHNVWKGNISKSCILSYITDSI